MYISPEWFYGYDVAFEALFALTSLIISYYAFKVHRISDQRSARLLGLAFLSIGIGYLIESVFNFLILSNVNRSICGLANVNSIDAFNAMGIYAHSIFFLAGLVVLVYMVLKVDRPSVLALLLGFTLILLALSSNILLSYYLLASILLAIIAWQYGRNFLANRQTKTLLVAIAFAFLFFGSVHFFMSVNHEIYYAIGHFLEFAAYMLILINLFLVLKR